MSANDRQVAGEHYRKPIQPWDFIAANGLDFFQGTIIKYLCRWREKGGVQDLEKAQHYLEKYIELQHASQVTPATFPKVDWVCKKCGVSGATSAELVPDYCKDGEPHWWIPEDRQGSTVPKEANDGTEIKAGEVS